MMELPTHSSLPKIVIMSTPNEETRSSEANGEYNCNNMNVSNEVNNVYETDISYVTINEEMDIYVNK